MAPCGNRWNRRQLSQHCRLRGNGLIHLGDSTQFQLCNGDVRPHGPGAGARWPIVSLCSRLISQQRTHLKRECHRPQFRRQCGELGRGRELNGFSRATDLSPLMGRSICGSRLLQLLQIVYNRELVSAALAINRRRFDACCGVSFSSRRVRCENHSEQSGFDAVPDFRSQW